MPNENAEKIFKEEVSKKMDAAQEERKQLETQKEILLENLRKLIEILDSIEFETGTSLDSDASFTRDFQNKRREIIEQVAQNLDENNQLVIEMQRKIENNKIRIKSLRTLTGKNFERN